MLETQTLAAYIVTNRIESVPEDQLGGESRFRHRLRLDTYGHYPKHANAIRKWRHVTGD